MVFVILGIIVIGVAIVVLWYFMPTKGQVHRLVTAPVLEWLIPVAIMGTLSIGVAMVVSGLAG